MLPADPLKPEQALLAARAVYEFGTDRAVLTDALLHSYDPASPAPLVVRAREMRKLGADTYEADHATITTSNFSVPSLSLSASKVTIRQDSSTDGNTRTVFRADNVVPRIWSVPVFYFPIVYGTSTDGGLPLRDIAISNSGGFGTRSTRRGASSRRSAACRRRASTRVTSSTTTPRAAPRWASTRVTRAGSSTSPRFSRTAFRAGSPPTPRSITAPTIWAAPGTSRLSTTISAAASAGNHQQFLSDGWQCSAGGVRQRCDISRRVVPQRVPQRERSGHVALFEAVGRQRGVQHRRQRELQRYRDVRGPTARDDPQPRRPVADHGRAAATGRISQDRRSLGDDRFTWLSNNSAAGLHFDKSYATLLTNYGFRDKNKADNNDAAFTGLPSYGYTWLHRPIRAARRLASRDLDADGRRPLPFRAVRSRPLHGV